MDTVQSDFETIRLLRFEAVQLRSPTITRVTFYEGRAPLEFIKGKLAEIFDANPWLQGRLSRSEKKLMLRYPRKPMDVDRFVRVVDIPELRFDMGFAELAHALRDLVVKRGSACVDKAEDLFRVAVANISDSQFAVMVSMSHVYADGHTFYEVYKMLSSTEPVRSLIADRVYTSRDDMDAVIRGGSDALPWLSSPGFIVNVVGSTLRRRAPTLNVFAVDRDKIGERKEEYGRKNEGRFITTNDILTSALFSATACDLIFMSVNFRDRVPTLTGNHAGNYETFIAFQREDFARPELIHAALKDYRRVISGKLPGFWRSTRVKVGAITNLASLYRDVELPGCRLLFHRPVVEATLFSPLEAMVYVFRSRQDQMALITGCKETSALKNLDILGERIV